jgi:hypothetical protein
MFVYMATYVVALYFIIISLFIWSLQIEILTQTSCGTGLYLGFGTNTRSLSASTLTPAKPRLYGQPTAKTHPHLMKPGEGKQVFLVYINYI